MVRRQGPSERTTAGRGKSTVRHLLGLACLLMAACGEGSTPAALAAGSLDKTPLTDAECEALVERALSNFSGSPAARQQVSNCQNGRGTYTREYYDCVFQSKFSDPLDCLYKARGIDRSIKHPALKYRQVGDYGHYSGSVASMASVKYGDENPRTTIDKRTLKLYLDRRDRAFEMAGETAPNDRQAPARKRSFSIDADGMTYWVVEQAYSELRLMKIMRETDSGFDEVFCARYGPTNGFGIDSGYCAALVQAHLGVSLVPANKMENAG